jgi:protein O-GlcNAc transferase
VQLPVHTPLRSAQEVVALKQKESGLADQLLRDFPKHVDALVKKAAACQRNGDPREAMVFLKKALKTDPQRVDIHLRMAQIAVDSGQLEQAIAHYRQIQRLQPQKPDVLSKLAATLMLSGKLDEAVAVLKEEVGMSPSSSHAHFTLGQVYLQQKKYPQAHASYEAAIKLKPDLARAYYGLARVHSLLGNRNHAKAYSEQFRAFKTSDRQRRQEAKTQNDDFAVAQRIAAITYTDIALMYRDQGNTQKAEDLLKQGAGLDPNNITCLYELASLYNTNGAPLKALQLFKQINHIQPDYVMGHYMTGVLSVRLKRFENAETAFNTVIRLTPKAANGYRELAGLYLKTGKKLPQARQLAQKALSLQPSAINYYILGWACSLEGDKAAALTATKRALTMEPGNPNFQRLYESIQPEN